MMLHKETRKQGNRETGNNALVYPYTWVRARLQRWRDDDAGATTPFMLTILCLFLFVVLGFHAIWEVISLRQALRVGTYQAARYLSSEPPQTGNKAHWDREAERMVLRELEQNVIVRAQEARKLTSQDPRGIGFSVAVDAPVPTPDRCREAGNNAIIEFFVTARLGFQVNLLENLPVTGGLNVPFNLVERQRGEIRCQER